MIASYLLLVAHTAAGVQAPDVQSVSRFVEQLVASEIVLQLDRREVVATKANKNSVRALMNDAANTRTIIQTFEDQVLSKAAEPHSPAVAELKTSLQNFKTSLDAENLIPKKAKDSSAPCCEHYPSYTKLVGAALRYPGLSLATISKPTMYNLSPLFYEPKMGPVYADAAYPTEARILPRSARRGSKLRRDDVIVAFRKEGEEKWEAVKSWGDVLEDSAEFGRENRISIQVRRNNSLKTILLSTTVVATEGG